MQTKDPDIVIGTKFRIYEISGWVESVILGDGAGWCVADTKDYFKKYTAKGELWYVHKKSGGKWRAWCSVFRSKNKDFEIAKRGNDHLQAHELAKQAPDLVDWLKSLEAVTEERDLFESDSHESERDISAMRQYYARFREAMPGIGDQRALDHARELLNYADAEGPNADRDRIMRERFRDVINQYRVLDRHGGEQMRQNMIANRERYAQWPGLHMGANHQQQERERRHHAMDRQYQYALESLNRHTEEASRNMCPRPNIPTVGELSEIHPQQSICTIGGFVRLMADGALYGLRQATVEHDPRRACYLFTLDWCRVQDNERHRIDVYLDAELPLMDPNGWEEMQRRLML